LLLCSLRTNKEPITYHGLANAVLFLVLSTRIKRKGAFMLQILFNATS
jgi:hypothetical protein